MEKKKEPVSSFILATHSVSSLGMNDTSPYSTSFSLFSVSQIHTAPFCVTPHTLVNMYEEHESQIGKI